MMVFVDLFSLFLYFLMLLLLVIGGVIMMVLEMYCFFVDRMGWLIDIFFIVFIVLV